MKIYNFYKWWSKLNFCQPKSTTKINGIFEEQEKETSPNNKKKIFSNLQLVDYSDDSDSDEGKDEKHINYSDDKENVNKEQISIKILEKESKDYGLFIWDSSVVISWYLYSFLKNDNNFWNDKVCLEISSGVSLPSILLCKLGSKVLITDRSNDFEIIKNNILNNLLINNIIIKDNFDDDNNLIINENVRNKPILKDLSWGNFENIKKDNNFNLIDYIIISDCFYDNTIDYDNIFSTFYFFLLKNKNLKILISYQVRCNEKTISNYLNKWNLKCEVINNLNEIIPPSEIISSEIILLKLTL